MDTAQPLLGWWLLRAGEVDATGRTIAPGGLRAVCDGSHQRP
jgi:hypothetical protein